MPTLQEDKNKTTPQRRYWIPALSKDPDTRSVQIGLLWTVLVHVILLLLAPRIFHNEFTPGRFVLPGSSAKTYEVELAPDAFLPKNARQAPPQQFVETNPDANNNIPDNTNNFGAQNQQAAQPVPDKDSTLRMPKTEGKKDFENATQVVSGSLEKQQVEQPEPPTEEQKASTQDEEKQRKLEVPNPGFVKSQGDNPNTFGTEAVRFPEAATGSDKRVEGDRNAKDTAGSGAKAAEQVRQKPMPRPRLTPVRNAILQERPVGVSNAGVIGVDAHFSQFGEYLQRLVETVDMEWNNILRASAAGPKPSTHVMISFKINSQGEVSEILKVDGDAGEYGTSAALSGIKNRSPYGPWTKDMIAVLGEEQTITFTFYYW